MGESQRLVEIQVLLRYQSVNPTKEADEEPAARDTAPIQQAIVLDDGTLSTPASVSMIQAMIPLGLRAAEDALLRELQTLAGPRYSRGEGEPDLPRWCAQRGSIYLAEQKLQSSVSVCATGVR